MGTTGLGLDIGAQRIGVAAANLSVRFAGPLVTLDDPASFLNDIIELCRQREAAWIVAGRPRGMDGQETEQTRRVLAFGAELEARLASAGLHIPLYWIDEALTSHKAEAELQNRRKPYQKGDVDALAATFILEDFLKEHHV
jgi:putative Holliday junction resolvase